MAKKTDTAIKKRTVRFAADQKITLLVEVNPKRPNTQAFKRFELYQDGMTVADAMKAGVTRRDFSYDVEHEYIGIA